MVKYTGEGLKTAIKLPQIGTIEPQFLEKKQAAKTIAPYIPDANLIEAVNLAIILNRPLLVMGEPGCGKSALAEAVAYELFHGATINGKVQDYRQWLFKWHIKSTTRAKDGFYEYDALRRLLDVQLSKDLPEKRDKAMDSTNYVEARAMAEAIQKSTLHSNDVQKYAAVLLIDEIDKADLDFPNDLLNELEGGEFTVPETGKPVFTTPDDHVRTQPLIIITSNREKELPEAFLRRCIYYYIPPFDAPRLKEILEYRFYAKNTETAASEKHKELRDTAVDAFMDIRSRIQLARSAGKNISTSELIDWFSALKSMSEAAGKDGTDAEIDKKLTEIKAFLNEQSKTLPLPLQQALFKNYETAALFKK